MRKFRGHGRYYRRLRRKGETMSLDLSEGQWYEFQTWLEIDAVDGSQDALYFHTPNPNHLRRDPPVETFPCNFEGVKWDVNPPNLFAQFVDHSRMLVGVGDGTRDNGAARPYYYVRMR